MVTRSPITFAVLILLAPFRNADAGQLHWEERPAAGPSARGEYGFAYASNRQVAVLHGGSADLSFTAVNSHTWEWNGSSWILANMGGPTARCDQAMAFDSNRNLVVIFGGYNGAFFGDTWEWNGTSWANANVTGPGPRADSFMAFDRSRGFMVLFGGLAQTGAVRGDTWEYNGAWSQQATTGPPTRWIQRMAYDSDRGVTVMFGGVRPTGLLSDTWEWDGSAWNEVVIPGPQARYGHAMAYDPDRQVVVLFGGQFGSDFGEGVLGDTWEYDGSAWTQAPISGPSARTFVKMVYDSNRRRMVLFGGYDGTQMVADTWELVDGPITGVGETESPSGPLLPLDNLPNPFQDRTTIRYQLPSDSQARLTIYDVEGAVVRTLIDRALPAGIHLEIWDGRDQRGVQVASGAYYYRLTAPGIDEQRRMLLVR
jgi:hypothetical protein